jgi:hypothetical protein
VRESIGKRAKMKGADGKEGREVIEKEKKGREKIEKKTVRRKRIKNGGKESESRKGEKKGRKAERQKGN